MLIRKLKDSDAIRRYRGKHVVGPDGFGVVYGGYCVGIFRDSSGMLYLKVHTREEFCEGFIVYLRQSLCTIK